MSSGFVTENEILEARRRRQEEWDKVRTEDQPAEAPEEEYDTRPLYQRLEEQRLKKDAEFEEAYKLKNMIRGLDDDEVGFLDLVERSKVTAAMQISAEEQREIQEFRYSERVANLAESAEMQRLRAQIAPARPVNGTTSNINKNKLQGVVVRKRKVSELDEEKQDKGATPAKVNGVVSCPKTSPPAPTPDQVPEAVSALRCVGVLPGLGHYSDTDSSSDHSDSDESDKCCVKRDLLGRLADQHDTKRKEEAKTS